MATIKSKLDSNLEYVRCSGDFLYAMRMYDNERRVAHYEQMVDMHERLRNLEDEALKTYAKTVQSKREGLKEVVEQKHCRAAGRRQQQKDIVRLTGEIGKIVEKFKYVADAQQTRTEILGWHQETLVEEGQRLVMEG